MTNLLQRGFEAQAKALVDFGYPNVTPDEVAAAHARWIKREPMRDVIEHFCASAFGDHPEIFGEQEA